MNSLKGRTEAAIQEAVNIILPGGKNGVDSSENDEFHSKADIESSIRSEIKFFVDSKGTTSGKGLKVRLQNADTIMRGMGRQFSKLIQTLGRPGLAAVISHMDPSIENPLTKVPELLMHLSGGIRSASANLSPRKGDGAAAVGHFLNEPKARTAEMMFVHQLWKLWWPLHGIPEMPEAALRDTRKLSEFQKFLKFAWCAAKLSAQSAARKKKSGPDQGIAGFETFVREHAMPMHQILRETFKNSSGPAPSKIRIAEHLGQIAGAANGGVARPSKDSVEQ